MRSYHCSYRAWLLVACLAVLQACSGGGGGQSAEVDSAPGSVGVVLDTRTGTDSLVQFVVVGATLERADGTTTRNLVPRAVEVTFADPTGEVSGLRLHDVPTGDYERLLLALAPGSGSALGSDGVVRAIDSGSVLSIPIADGLQHVASEVSWLALGHNRAPVVTLGGSLRFEPALLGRADGSEHELAGLEPVTVRGASVDARLPAAGGGVLALEFAPGCTFGDDDANSFASAAAFVNGLRGDDELRVCGTLDRSGGLRVTRARRGRGNDGPRLLGRIVELRPATTSFVMRVQAEVRRGERVLRDPPFDVLVDATSARLQRPNGQVVLAFADLAVDDLVKVTWSSRTPATATELELVVAREIEVPGSAGVPLAPEWQGLVQSVDVAGNRIVVVPRNDDPIVVDGVSVPSVDVLVDAGTVLQRRERRGGGRTTIQLGDIVPGEDRIWWRGTVTGPAEVSADWVRVREE